MTQRRHPFVLAALVVLASACGGETDERSRNIEAPLPDASSSTETTAPSASAATTAAPFDDDSGLGHRRKVIPPPRRLKSVLTERI